jgi:hypothetical protein
VTFLSVPSHGQNRFLLRPCSVFVGPELIAAGKKVSNLASYTPFPPAPDHGAAGQHVHFGDPVPMSIVRLGDGADRYLHCRIYTYARDVISYSRLIGCKARGLKTVHGEQKFWLTDALPEQRGGHFCFLPDFKETTRPYSFVFAQFLIFFLDK